MIATMRGEGLRLVRTPMPLTAAAAALLLGMFVPAVFAVVGPENATPPMPGLDTREGVVVVLGITILTLFVPAALGTLAWTSEFRHRTVTPTLLAVPARWKVLTAKHAVYAGAGLAYGVILAAAAGLTLQASALVTGTPLGLGPGELVLVLVRIALCAAAYTLIGVAVGAVVHSPLAAAGVVLGYFYLIEPVLMLVPGLGAAYPFLPGGATAGLVGFELPTQAVGEQTGASPDLLPPVLSAGVLLAYTALASCVALLAPLRRDVT